MPTPRLPLTTDARAAAFAYVVDLLKADPDLRRIRPVWRVPDDADYDEPPPAERVQIKLTPKLLPYEGFATAEPGKRLDRTGVRVTYEVTVPGDLWANSAAVVGAIEHALTRRGEQGAEALALWRALEALGVSDLELVEPGDTDVSRGPGSGAFELVMYLEA